MKNGEAEHGSMPGGSSRSRTATDAGLKARQKVIGAGLKRMFDDVVDEQVPDDFQDLLSKFDKENGSGGQS